MKKIMFILLLFTIPKEKQTVNADDLIGTWITEDKDAWVEFFKQGDVYYGKTVWHDAVKHQGVQTDIMNPNKNLKNRPIIGLIVIRNLIFKKDKWDYGMCYDPESGKSYSGYIELIDGNRIKLRGYIGIPLFGRSEIWTRKK